MSNKQKLDEIHEELQEKLEHMRKPMCRCCGRYVPYDDGMMTIARERKLHFTCLSVHVTSHSRGRSVSRCLQYGPGKED